MTRNLGNEISEHRLFLESLKKDIDSMNAKVNEFFRQLEGYSSKADMPSEFIAFRAETKERLNGLTSQIQSGIVFLRSLKEDLDGLRMEVSSLQTSSDSAHAIILSHKESSFHTEQRLSSEVAEMKKNLRDRLALHQEKVDLTMERFRDEIGTSPASIVETNTKLAKQLEDATKAIENFFVKSHNIDAHISGLEVRMKKLEGK